jgi:hypothetical protein
MDPQQPNQSFLLQGNKKKKKRLQNDYRSHAQKIILLSKNLLKRTKGSSMKVDRKFFPIVM